MKYKIDDYEDDIKIDRITRWKKKFKNNLMSFFDWLDLFTCQRKKEHQK